MSIEKVWRPKTEEHHLVDLLALLLISRELKLRFFQQYLLKYIRGHSGQLTYFVKTMVQPRIEYYNYNKCFGNSFHVKYKINKLM